MTEENDCADRATGGVADVNADGEANSDGAILKDARFMRLWDVYAPLLTARRREVTDLYFNYDLSLSEIAEQTGVSRQSVSDCLIKSRRQLEEYESKLKFAETAEELSLDFSLYVTRVEMWLTALEEKYPQVSSDVASLRAELGATNRCGGAERVKTSSGEIRARCGYRGDAPAEKREKNQTEKRD